MLEKEKEDQKSTLLVNKYRVDKFLGAGSTGKVFRATNAQTGDIVAIKQVEKQGLSDDELRQIQNEISVMKSLRHPNVVELYEVMATKTMIYLVMEYVAGGDLFAKIERIPKLEDREAEKYFWQLIKAVDFFHSRGIVHHDLKLENLLLDDHGNLKVADFGVSLNLPPDGLLRVRSGTPEYSAPEVVTENEGYDGAKADLWSCGVLLFIFLAGSFPFSDNDVVRLYEKIRRARYLFPPCFPGEVRQLVSRLLDPNPATRITIPEILKFPWIARAAEKTFPDGISSEKENFKPEIMNAFDIISMNQGLDLSRLFHDRDAENLRFTTKNTAEGIVSKLEEIAKKLQFRVTKGDSSVHMTSLEVGRKGRVGIEARVLELAPYLYEVEMSKKSGDTLEYKKFRDEKLRPALKDIAWAPS